MFVTVATLYVFFFVVCSCSLRIDVQSPAVAPAAKTAPIVLITSNGDDVAGRAGASVDAGHLSPSMQVIREIERGKPTTLPKRAVSPIHAALLRNAEEQDGDVTEQAPASPRHLKVAPASPTQRSVSPTLLAVLKEEEQKQRQHGGASDYAPAASPTKPNTAFDGVHSDDVSASKQSRSFRMLQAEVGADDVTKAAVVPAVAALNGGALLLRITCLRFDEALFVGVATYMYIDFLRRFTVIKAFI